ncbi:SusC/RagA family TonB-linked outer membrane protein [Bacteroidota bacterium]
MNKKPTRMILINKKLLLFYLAIALLLSLNMSELVANTIEQTDLKKISGNIVSETDGGPIPGANILIKGTTKGTITDMDGNFVIEASDEDILIISFIGFINQEIPVKGKTNINIKLVEDITKLDEVVVIGYGQMKRSDLAGSVVSVTSNDISRSLTASFDQALQGKAAGVQVTQNTGAPGGGVSVRIRGVSSLSGQNEPLYVIDGVPIEAQVDNFRYGSSTGNVLSTINTSDIVDIQILKDASATAIYGSRAANGVVLITTKQGEKGESKVSYDGYYGIQQLPTYIPTMNLREFAEFRNERQLLVGHGGRDEYADPSILGEGTNWQKEMFENAPMTSHQLSLTGGSEKTTFAFSAGYLKQDGIAVGSNFNRYNFKLNVNNKAREWLTVGSNIIGSRSIQNITIENRNLINETLKQTPDVAVKNPDGTWAGPDESPYGTYVTNVVAEALLRENLRKNSKIIASAYAEIKIFKDLVLKNELSGDISYNQKYEFQPTYDFGEYVKEITNKSSRAVDNGSSWNFNNYLIYTKTLFKLNDISITFGHEAREQNWENLTGTRYDFFSNNIRELDAGDFETSEASGSKGDFAMESFFGRAFYSYSDKYIAYFTLRGDGTSKFGPEKRWGYFPSFALAWKVNNESFMSNLPFINTLKVRGSWGQIGNQNITDYAYGSPLGNRATVWGTGVLPQRIGNPSVQWESTEATNIGFDLYMFENRIEFIFDAYNRQTDNLLMDLQLPSYAGTSGGDYTGAINPPVFNIGALENKGVEFTLNTVNIDRNDFRWRTGIVFSLNRNKVLKMNSDSAVINRPLHEEDGTIVTRTVVGQPIGMFYGYAIEGMYETEDDFYMKDANGNILLDDNNEPVMVALPVDAQAIHPSQIWLGDYKYKDFNGDTLITEADRTFIGNPHPKFTLGFNTSIEYKNFDLSIDLWGVIGNKVLNYTRLRYEDPNSILGVFKSVKDFARIGVIDTSLRIDPGTGLAAEPNEIISNVYLINEGTNIPRITNDNANDNNRLSDRFIEDGSYVRIKNLILGYTLPGNITNKLNISELRVYVNIQNLYTFTKYKGYDPEIGSYNQDMLNTGIDNGRYPTARTYTFGLHVNF